MKGKEEILKIIREVREDLRVRYKVKEIGVFGSVIRAEQKETSDIEIFVEDMNFESFRNDNKTTSAVIRKFEIMGEATKQIPDKIRQKYSEVPWKEMAGMRDRLIHSLK
jgi:predicted nucleotidyltransferase